MTDRLGRRRSIARPLPPKQAPFSKRAYQSSAAEPLSQVWSRSQKDAAGERLDARGGSAGAIGRDSRFVISFPVVNDAIRNAIASIQHAVGRQRPSLIACSVDPASLHVPLAELEIESPASTSTARGALQEFHLLLPFLLPQTTNLRFDGLFVHGDADASATELDLRLQQHPAVTRLMASLQAHLAGKGLGECKLRSQFPYCTILRGLQARARHSHAATPAKCAPRLRPDLDLNPVSTGDAEPHSDDVWRGTAGGPATKALGDMNAVKAALPL